MQGVERLEHRLYSGDRDEATAEIDVVVAGGSLQLSGLGFVNATEGVLHTLDLVSSDQDVDAPVSSCVKAADVNSRTRIILIALEKLEFFVPLLEWTKDGG